MLEAEMYCGEFRLMPLETTGDPPFPPVWNLTFSVPSAVGSGKLGTPCERMQLTYASAARYLAVVLPLFPAAEGRACVVDRACVAVVGEPTLATPGEADPPSQADRPNPTMASTAISTALLGDRTPSFAFMCALQARTTLSTVLRNWRSHLGNSRDHDVADCIVVLTGAGTRPSTRMDERYSHLSGVRHRCCREDAIGPAPASAAGVSWAVSRAWWLDRRRHEGNRLLLRIDFGTMRNQGVVNTTGPELAPAPEPPVSLAVAGLGLAAAGFGVVCCVVRDS